MKNLIIVLFSFYSLFGLAKPNKPIEKNISKVFYHNKQTGEIEFRDTESELLKEIYFYNSKNEIIGSVKNIDENKDFEIGCWNQVHHITIITDKKVHYEFVK